MSIDTDWVTRQQFSKSYKPMPRPKAPEEDHLRETLDAALRDSPLYGHPTMTRARNIYVSKLLDQHYIDSQVELAA